MIFRRGRRYDVCSMMYVVWRLWGRDCRLNSNWEKVLQCLVSLSKVYVMCLAVKPSKNYTNECSVSLKLTVLILLSSSTFAMNTKNYSEVSVVMSVCMSSLNIPQLIALMNPFTLFIYLYLSNECSLSF